MVPIVKPIINHLFTTYVWFHFGFRTISLGRALKSETEFLQKFEIFKIIVAVCSS